MAPKGKENQVALGRIVQYVLSERDVQRGYKARNETGSSKEGNPIQVGWTCPMMIVAILPYEGEPRVNGQVFLDGNDTLWVEGREHSLSGQLSTWHWHDEEIVLGAQAELAPS